MFQKIGIFGAGLIASLTLTGAVVLAQSPATTTPGVQQGRERGDRLTRRGLRRHRRRAALGALRQLNLTDQQKEQARAIRRASFESNKEQRQELRQLMLKRRDGTLTDADMARARELRNQLRESRKNTRTQLVAILTAEQRAKLQEIIKNRRENRERFGRRGPLNRPN